MFWILLALSSLLFAAVFTAQILLDQHNKSQAKSNSTTPSATSSPLAATTTVTATPKPTPLLKNIKPIVENTGGELVLLSRDGDERTYRCTWLRWGGELDFSDIRCRSFNDRRPFTVKTVYLTPVG